MLARLSTTLTPQTETQQLTVFICFSFTGVLLCDFRPSKYFVCIVTGSKRYKVPVDLTVFTVIGCTTLDVHQKTTDSVSLIKGESHTDMWLLIQRVQFVAFFKFTIYVSVARSFFSNVRNLYMKLILDYLCIFWVIG